MNTSKTDRILGCLYGGAIGDAFGGHYEGMVPSAHIDELSEWRLSDDTQLTLATCEAIGEIGKVDPERIASCFREWFQARRLSGLGASTLKALSELAHGGHWALVGRKGEMAAGNGAAMRIAPLAFLLDPVDPNDRRTIRDVCRITHHSDEAYVGALAVLCAVRAAWLRTWDGGAGLISQVVECLPDSRVRDRMSEMSRVSSKATLFDLATKYGNSGYVVETVPLAIYGASLVSSLGFEAVLTHLVRCGGDTDTIASITGQITGAYVGYKELPKNMLVRLPERDLLRNIAEKFTRVVG